MDIFEKLLKNKKFLWTVAAIAVLVAAGLLLMVLLPDAVAEPNPSVSKPVTTIPATSGSSATMIPSSAAASVTTMPTSAVATVVTTASAATIPSTAPTTTLTAPTVPPSTTVPTTVPPSTAVPTTVPPTTAATAPTTAAPVTTAPPMTTVPPTTAPSQFTELYVGKAYHVTVGTNHVTFAPNGDGLTYFLFIPEQSGTYTLTASAQLRYFGSDTSRIWDQTDNMGIVNNTLTLNVKQTSLFASYVLAVKTAAGSGTLTVSRIGEATLEWEDLPYNVYNGIYTPKDFTYTGGTLTYVNVTGEASDFVLVLGSDGYYHLNGADGPLLYLNLGGSSANPAKETGITLHAMLRNNRPIRGTVKDENGNNLYKRQYNDLVQKYIDCADRGLYPLTPDLVEILKTQNDNNWYPSLVDKYPQAKRELTWMANICYEQR